MKTPTRTEPALLAALAPEALEKIRAQCATRRYEKDEQIVGELERGKQMYFIERGRARVTLLSYGGREVSFVDLAAGENFGELSLIDGQPRSANVIALTECEIMVMPENVFQRLLDAHPRIAFALLRQLTAMVRRLCERIFEFSTIGVNQRLHAELLRLAKKHIELDGVARIPNAPTHAQLASRISCHREAVTRELNSLENAGVLAREKRKLIVPEIRRLQQMVDLVNGAAPQR
ncbi:MAG: Crp/Fnr family transcriptional regulator [Gammaproteobacteria bacterium]|nr:Crp/Fnr family transcriptional regulator [Gammaproteobacteria bacterium]